MEGSAPGSHAGARTLSSADPSSSSKLLRRIRGVLLFVPGEDVQVPPIRTQLRDHTASMGGWEVWVRCVQFCLATVVDFGTLDSETQSWTGGQVCEPICEESDVPEASMAALQKPSAEGGAVGQCAVLVRGLNSHAVRDACEAAGHMTTHASGAEAANMLCWCRVASREPEAATCRAGVYLAP